MKLHSVFECPKCGSDNLTVCDTRKRNNVIWRRRRCLDCGEKFSTTEIMADDLDIIERQSNIIRKMLTMTQHALELSSDETLDI